MITCSRCGKDNQDHYKFCLGCGAKLEAASAGGGEKASEALGLARTAVPPPQANVVIGMPEPEARSASGSLGGAGARSGEVVTPPPVRPSVGTPAAPAGHGGAVNGAGNAAAGALGRPVGAAAPRPSDRPLPGMVSAPSTAPATTPTGAVAPTGMPMTPAPSKDAINCPKCGKTVAANFAFCGSCGQRLKPAAGAAPAAAAAPRTMFTGAGATKAAARGHLTLIRPDGTEGGMHPLHEGENLIGRGQGALFDADPYLSPRHAEFMLTDDGLMVRDLRSLNGVFVKISQEEALDSGDIFRIGQELLRFDLIAPPSPLEDGTEIIGTPNPGYWGRISVIVGRDVDGPAFPLFDEAIVLGRERGDILFPEDGYVSGTHAQIALRNGQVFLSDLGSSNGTFFRIRGTRNLPPGSLILMGQQLFRVAYR